MKIGVVKRMGLVAISFMFSLLSFPNVALAKSFGAAAEKSESATLSEEDEVKKSGKTYCDAGSAVLFARFCDNVESEPLGAGNVGAGVSTITMHVKEGEGYFEGEADPLTHSGEFYYRDAFDDYTVPTSLRSDYVFAGWSFSEEATSVDVEMGSTRSGQINGHLYAVWSDKAYVYYHMINSAWIDPTYEDAYQHVMMEYDAGTTFANLNPEPTPNESFYDFMGWYETMGGKGDKYVAGETVIDTLITDVYTAWNYNASRMEDELILGEASEVTVGMSIPVFKFTAPETGMYEIYTDGIESGDTEYDSYQALIRVEDIFDRTLAMEEQMDYPDGWGDVHTYYEMEAGETYYIRFLEGRGLFLRFDAYIRRPEMVDVTFHANLDGAYFDDDTTKTTKTLSLPVGKDIRVKNLQELTYDTNEKSFAVWQTEVDDGHSYLLVSEDTTDVFATYIDMVAVTLDYNGGHDPIKPEITSTVARFLPGRSFKTPIDPNIDDPNLDFVGWSRNPEATAPDSDIVEGQIEADALKNQTLYAVYGERAPVTFVTPYGAYMIDDPNTTVFESSLAIGHIFYGMAVMHDDLNVVHAGWTDQNGVRTYQTDDIDPRYKIQGDTTFTAVLEYRLIGHANGGVFPNGGIGGAEDLAVQLPYIGDEDTFFSYDAVLDRTGVPQNYNSSKYFVGFSRSDEATEAEINDETLAVSLNGHFFAVWADDEYYVAEGEGVTWERGSSEGARIVVKRKGNDDLTYQAFNGVALDGEEIDEDDFTDERGSLVLTLEPEYLETLEDGEHELTVHFIDYDRWTGEEFPTDVTLTIAVAEASDDEIVPIPDTGANSHEGTEYAMEAAGIVALMTVVGALTLMKRKSTKR